MDNQALGQDTFKLAVDASKLLQKNITAAIAKQSRVGKVSFELRQALQDLSNWMFEAQTRRIPENNLYSTWQAVYMAADNAFSAWLYTALDQKMQREHPEYFQDVYQWSEESS